jgi:chemotaxis protein methyltransferase CheR
MTVDWSTAGHAEVADLVRERTGLVFPNARVRDVEATIRRTMARRNITDLEDLLVLLRDDVHARESFVADLTIGESYFQRDPGQFDVLRAQILPRLLASRPGNAPVRVWSAGCATGEEPYTIAMVFEEMAAAGRSHIVATDIARGRLEDAQRGLYSTWQLRGTPEAVRSAYFAERGKFFELTPRIRHRVDFRYLNLSEDSFPSLSTGVWGMDVIFCRNVLIYFDAPTVERVARRLIASLSEDGWLLLGASDPTISEMVECDVVVTDAGLAYRRRGAGGPADIRTGREGIADTGPHPAPVGADARIPADVWPAPVHTDAWSGPTWELPDGVAADADRQPETSAPPADADHQPDPSTPLVSVTAAGSARPDRVDEILAAYAKRDFGRVHALAESSARTGSLNSAAWIAWVRSLANEGRIGEAGETVARAMEQPGAAPELLYLHAVLLLQSGRPADAAAAARRALYLDRSLVVAHLTLAEAQRRSGSMDAARRALRNATALLTSFDPSAVVPASDGETAGRLAELVRVKLNLLGGSE